MGASYRSFGLFGLILLAFGILGGLVTGDWNALYVLVHLIGGASMLGLYLFTHIENLRESVTGRRSQYATNTVVYTLVTLAVIVLVNYVGAQNEMRYDASAEGIFSIAPQTRELLAGLDSDVELLAFFREAEGAGAQRLLDSYASESERFTYTMVDPDKRPELAQQYEVTQYGTLVLDRGDETTRITELSEEALTNALIRLMAAEGKRIYFTAGHGEPDLEARETPDGLGQLKAALENEGATVRPLLLATLPDVPADADLLVIAGPQRAFLDNEIETLRRFLDRGGRALFLIEPRASAELVALFAERGVTVGDDVIIDQVVQLFAGPTVGVEPVVSQYGSHPITQEFAQNTLFRIARSVKPAAETPAGVTVTTLASTSPASWAESNVEQVFETGEVDPEGDEPGPVSLAVAVSIDASALHWTVPAIETAPDVGDAAGEDTAATDTEDAAAEADPEASAGEGAGEAAPGDPAATAAAPDSGASGAGDPAAESGGAAATDAAGAPQAPADLEGRLVVVGDSEWVNNSRLSMLYNEDLALNMVGWLTGGAEETIAIRPRARRASRISLTEAQGWAVFYSTVLLLPELVLLSGLVIWWRRRR
jgi:ABC-type uncharacterized transport system involved in gliding motility auxiliary subunit